MLIGDTFPTGICLARMSDKSDRTNREQGEQEDLVSPEAFVQSRVVQKATVQMGKRHATVTSPRRKMKAVVP